MNETELKGKMITGVLWKFSERFFAQGVSFAVSLVLARILVPDDYGVVAVINMFIAIADVFLSSGLNASLIQKKDADEIDFSTIFHCNLLLSIFLYMVLFFSAPIIASIYKMPVLINAIRVFALRLPISSFQSIQTAYVSKKMDFRKFFFATAVGTVISAIVGIFMAVKGYGVWALIAQYMTNTIIDTTILFAIVKWYPSRVFSWSRAKPLIKYGGKVLLTDLIGTVFNYLGDFVIGYKYSSADLAYYSKGRQLPAIFKTNLSTTLVSVLFPGMSNVNQDLAKVKNISRNSIKVLTFIIYPIMIGVMVIAKPLTVFLYSEKWLPMVPFVKVVCFEAILSVPSTIALQILKATGRSDLMLKSEFIKKPFSLLAILIASRFGIFAVSLTLPFNTLLELIINGYFVKKTIDYKYSELLSDVLPAFMMSVIMGCVVSATSLLPINHILIKLLVCGIAGVATYLFLSVVSKNREFIMLLDFARYKLGISTPMNG